MLLFITEEKSLDSFVLRNIANSNMKKITPLVFTINNLSVKI